jgi:hypothetical protein
VCVDPNIGRLITQNPIAADTTALWGRTDGANLRYGLVASLEDRSVRSVRIAALTPNPDATDNEPLRRSAGPPAFPLRPHTADEHVPLMKRAMDVTGSLIALVLLSPLLLVIALTIKLTSKGPVFCRRRTPLRLWCSGSKMDQRRALVSTGVTLFCR